MNHFVTKASGEKELFSEGKVRESVIRSGASQKTADEFVKAVKKKIKPGIKSREIHEYTSRYLAKKDPKTAARYSLKNAMMKLGPDGFLFEKYVSRILEAYGYNTRVGIIVNGHCVTHEIDVIAIKNKKHFMIECKYHNKPGIKSNVKTALYVHSRFLDVEKAWKIQKGHGSMFHEGWLVTNTKCTSDAVQYARCAGLKILAWRYPTKRGLEYLIDKKGLYPLSIIPSLTRFDMKKLNTARLLLAKDLLEYSPKDLVNRFSIKLPIARKILNEAREICAC